MYSLNFLKHSKIHAKLYKTKLSLFSFMKNYIGSISLGLSGKTKKSKYLLHTVISYLSYLHKFWIIQKPLKILYISVLWYTCTVYSEVQICGITTLNIYLVFYGIPDNIQLFKIQTKYGIGLKPQNKHL